jgi:hypothetical protein
MVCNIVLVGFVLMVSKANYTGSINGIMECILVTTLKGATPVPSLFFLSRSLHACVSSVDCLCCGGGGFLPTAVVCNYLVYLYFLLIYGLSGCLMFKKDASF